MKVVLCFIKMSSKVVVNSLARMKHETIEIAQRAPIGKFDPTSNTNPENAQMRNKVLTLMIPLANLPR